MSIASRIEQMEQHLTDDYSMLEVAGADLTNVDKNIENLKQTWKERLLYFMDNGTDVVWENWDKVTGEGTSLTLNNTLEGKMSIILKGNTSQTGTPTPTTPQPLHTVSGYNEIKVTGKNLFDEVWEDGTINATTGQNQAGNNVRRTKNYISVKPSTTYILSRGTTINTIPLRTYGEDKSYIGAENCILNEEKSHSFTTGNNVYYIRLVDWGNGSENVMLEKGSTASQYEPYKEKTYEINLGKNLFSGWEKGKGISSTNGSLMDNSNGAIGDYIPVDFNTNANYYISGLTDTITSFIGAYNSSKQFLGRTGGEKRTGMLLNSSSFTSGTPQGTGDIAYIIVYQYKLSADTGTIDDVDNLNTQLEVGSKATSYSEYFTPIELCKIGTYQDKIDKSTGKNLFDNTNISGGYKANASITTIDTGVRITSTVTSNGYYMCVLPLFDVSNYVGKTFTLKCNFTTSGTASGRYIIGICDKDGGNRIAGPNTSTSGQSISYTIPELTTSTYLGVWFYVAIGSLVTTGDYVDYTNIMVNEGSTALPYEPYGTGWYKYGAIRHLSLAISDMNNNDNYPGWTNQTQTKNDYPGVNTNFGAITDYLSNINIKNTSFSRDGVLVNTTTNGLVMLNKIVFDLTQTQWLANYPNLIFELYYGLQTPTYTKIDGELETQLNALARSFNTQTNISQENSDISSILNATALSDI